MGLLSRIPNHAITGATGVPDNGCSPGSTHRVFVKHWRQGGGGRGRQAGRENKLQLYTLTSNPPTKSNTRCQTGPPYKTCVSKTCHTCQTHTNHTKRSATISNISNTHRNIWTEATISTTSYFEHINPPRQAHQHSSSVSDSTQLRRKASRVQQNHDPDHPDPNLAVMRCAGSGSAQNRLNPENMP